MCPVDWHRIFPADKLCVINFWLGCSRRVYWCYHFLWWMYFSVLFMLMSNEFHALWKLGHCEHGVGREFSDWWKVVISLLDTSLILILTVVHESYLSISWWLDILAMVYEFFVMSFINWLLIDCDCYSIINDVCGYLSWLWS